MTEVVKEQKVMPKAEQKEMLKADQKEKPDTEQQDKDVSALTCIKIEKEGRAYQALLPATAPIGEALDFAFALIDKIIRASQRTRDNIKENIKFKTDESQKNNSAN